MRQKAAARARPPTTTRLEVRRICPESIAICSLLRFKLTFNNEKASGLVPTKKSAARILSFGGRGILEIKADEPAGLANQGRPRVAVEVFVGERANRF